MEKLHKLLKKKLEEGHTIPPMEKDAKMGVLKDLHKMASDSMADKIHGMKKVTVASPDEAGLEHGLEKAHEIVSHMPEMVDDAEDGDGRDGDLFAGGEDLEHQEEAQHKDLDGDDEIGESPEHQEAVMGHHGDHEDEASIDAKLHTLMMKKAAFKNKKA